MPTVAERLAAARQRLEAAGVTRASAALDAEVLARHLLAWDRGMLLARLRDPAPDPLDGPYEALLARRAAREPVAQILGVREFWGRDFELTRDVLVPRPETEMIVEEVLAFARTDRCERVIDVGTGSGCLAVTLAAELPAVHVAATDLSGAALVVASRNARRYGMERRVGFIQTDLLAGITGTADVIVSNPPYVREADAAAMQPEVLRFEPHVALFGGPTGFELITKLLNQARDRLASGGRLVVEFGFGQADDVQEIAEAAGWRVVRVREDLQGIPRTIVLA